MADLAELGVRVTSTGIDKAKSDLQSLGTTGEATAQRMGGITRAFDGVVARAQDFARAGANASQIAQLTGMSMTAAAEKVRLYGNTIAETKAEVSLLAAAQREMAAAGMKAETSFNTAGAGLGRLRMGFTSLVSQLTGVNPVLARTISTIGVMGAGTPLVIGVLAGTAGIMWAYNKLTESTRAAKEEQDKLTDALDKWYEHKKRGEAGERTQQTGAERGKLATDQQKLADALFDEQTLINGGDGAKYLNSLGRTLPRVKALVQELATAVAEDQAKIRAGVADVAGTMLRDTDESAQNYASSLAARLNFNHKDKDARTAALAELKKDQATYASLLKLPESPDTSARLESYARTIKELTDALNPKAKPTQAQRLDASELKKWNDEGNRAVKTADEHRNALDRELAEAIAYNDAVKQGQDAVDRYTDAKAALNAVEKDGAGLDAIGVGLLAAKAARLSEITRETQAYLAAVKAQTQGVKDESRAFQQVEEETQRSLAGFFDKLFSDRLATAKSFFDEVKAAFIKMLADMEAATLMKRASGFLAGLFGTTSGGSGSGGTNPGGTTVGLDGFGQQLLKDIGQRAGQAGVGFAVGNIIGAQTTNSGLGALGGAAGGAAAGFMMGGPVGAIIGGAAGLVGGFLGAKNSAKALAEAQDKLRLALLNDQASLAQWQASLTQSVADQRAAAKLEVQLKYEALRQEIDNNLKGRKNEAERAREQAEALDLYHKALTQATAGLEGLTGALNEVLGYKATLNALIYANAPTTGGGPVSGGGSGDPSGYGHPTGGRGGPVSTGGSGTGVQTDAFGNQTVNINIDGKTVAQVVLKQFQGAAQRKTGDTTKWSTVMAVA